MKLQRKTWFLLITAVFLCTAVYVYEIKFQQQLQIKSENNKLFSFTEENIKHIILTTQQDTLKFQKTKKYWEMIEPKHGSANDAAISFLINLLVTGEIDRQFIISTDQQKDYGLDKPLATIEIILNDKNKHQIILGNSDFNDRFLYARVDSNNQDEEDLTISLVPKNYRYAIDREVDEWLEIDESLKSSENVKLD